MNCAWDAFLSILPPDIRRQADDLGENTLQELRLRVGQPVELVLSTGSMWLDRYTSPQDLSFVINTASRYSPWAATSAAKGYITAPGGHRIGICGEAVMQKGEITGITNPSSLCIRIARDFPGVSRGCPNTGSVLILGPPGSGKTTLLRDMIRRRSDEGQGSVAVVDERGELFPVRAGFATGKRTDVITGCTKDQGLQILLRTAGPRAIAVDEITDRNDCQALIHAGWCGVDLMATAHAEGVQDLYCRDIYKPLSQMKLFDTVLVLRRDKSWKLERMKI